MLKRIVLAAVAVSFLAVPAAQAQQRHHSPQQGHHFSQPQKPAAQAPRRQQMQRPAPQRQVNRHAPQRHHAQRPGPSRHHWARGKRVPEWQRRQAVRDYHRHGLKRPARGQQWVRVDNDYLLISLTTGIIAGIVIGR